MFQVIFVEPLINIFRFLNSYLNDLGLTIIIFAVILKILISPLSFLQFKEEIRLKKINAKINKLTKKEKDILKKAEIISKIYEEEKFNPLYNFLIQLSTLPFYIAAIFVIQNIIQNSLNPYFLKIIDLTKPNIYLGIFVILMQLIFVFMQPKEQRKILLFITALFSVIILLFSSGLLLYILGILVLNLLERKLFNWYYIKFAIISVEENNPYRS